MKMSDKQHLLAETVAHVIAKAEKIGLPDAPSDLITSPDALRILAHSYLDLRDAIRALHDLVDLTDPKDPIGTALTKVGLDRRPRDWQPPPRVVRSDAEINGLALQALVELYCRVMSETPVFFTAHATFKVCQWDGMDGCWTDCTIGVNVEVGAEEALREWAKRTDGGTRRVAFGEIDYYRIFPGDAQHGWDGSEGRELFR
jgi:hypothetical protein